MSTTPIYAVMPYTDYQTACDAIRAKTGKADLIKSGDMATEIEGIQNGGSSPVQQKEVNFYDYDGTLLHSYTVEEAQALTALPDGPTHDGLVFQDWNWSLESVNALTRAMNIGAMYTTDDGTTRIYIHLEEGRTNPMLGVCPNGTVTVDWGDGTEPDTLTGTSTSTVQWTPNHEYAAPGDYVIRLTVDGEMGFSGTSTSKSYSCILRYRSAEDSRNQIYQNTVQKVEIGDGVTSIGTYAFHSCCSLASIIIPDGVTSIGTYAFHSCYSLASIIIPDGVMSIGSNTFHSCCSLASIIIPDDVTSIGTYAFQSCYSLASIIIPDGVMSIDNNTFQSCCSLASIIIPNGVTSIGTYAFQSCNSLASIIISDGVMSIGTYAFPYCSGVRYYDFTSHTAIPKLVNSNAFVGISADCEIRVPAALYDEWIAATNWSTYADYIVAV